MAVRTFQPTHPLPSCYYRRSFQSETSYLIDQHPKYKRYLLTFSSPSFSLSPSSPFSSSVSSLRCPSPPSPLPSAGSMLMWSVPSYCVLLCRPTEWLTGCDHVITRWAILCRFPCGRVIAYAPVSDSWCRDMSVGVWYQHGSRSQLLPLPTKFLTSPFPMAQLFAWRAPAPGSSDLCVCTFPGPHCSQVTGDLLSSTYEIKWNKNHIKNYYHVTAISLRTAVSPWWIPHLLQWMF